MTGNKEKSVLTVFLFIRCIFYSNLIIEKSSHFGTIHLLNYGINQNVT